MTMLMLGTVRAAGEDGQVFAIYSVAKDAPELAHVELDGEPIISARDLVAYDWRQHTIKLREGTPFRMPKTGEVGVSGKSFVVVAGGQRCYRGAWWTSLSSVATDVPVINVLEQKAGELHIELGYPPASFHSGADPRADPRVRQALLDVKKLTE